MKYLLILIIILFSCTIPVEDHHLRSPGGGIAHWDALDFPLTVLISEMAPVPFYESAQRTCGQLNGMIGGLSCLVQKVEANDYRLNGGTEYNSHVLKLEERAEDWQAITEVIYVSGFEGDKYGKLYGTFTTVNSSNTKVKEYDIILLHELGCHMMGLIDLYKDRTSICFVSAEGSNDQFQEEDKVWLRKQFQGLQ